MKDSKRIISSFILAIVALIWGTSFAVNKDALNIISPFSLMMFRFGFSTILISIIYVKKLKKIKLRDIKNGSLIGIFMFLSFFTMVIGAKYTTASKQSFIIGSYVLIVPFLSWIVNKLKPNLLTIFASIFATFGLLLLTTDSNMSINIGDIISILCAFFFASHIIAIERYGKDSDPIILTIVQFAVTSILFIILTGIFEDFDFSILNEVKFPVMYLVIICTVIPFAIQNVVQRFISSSTTALILTLQSAFGSIFAVYYLKETLSMKMIFGCLIIFIAILIKELKFDFLKRL